MIDQGNWFAVHRKILDSEVFADPHLLRLWIWLLARASFKTAHVSMSTGRGVTTVTLKPGQSIVGRKAGAEALEWKPSTFRYRLKRLEHMRMIDIESDTHWSVVSVVNWGAYQACGAAGLTPNQKAKLTPNGQANGATNNDKNGRSPDAKPEMLTPNEQATDRQLTQEKNAKNVKNNSTRKSRFRFDPSDLEFAKEMHAKILEVAPKSKTPNFDKWANDLRLLRGDGNTLDEIKRIFAWANGDRTPHGNNRFCWAPNIKSPAKLREKFAELHSRMPTRLVGHTSPPDAMNEVRRRQAEIAAKRKQEAIA